MKVVAGFVMVVGLVVGTVGVAAAGPGETRVSLALTCDREVDFAELRVVIDPAGTGSVPLTCGHETGKRAFRDPQWVRYTPTGVTVILYTVRSGASFVVCAGGFDHPAISSGLTATIRCEDRDTGIGATLVAR